MARKKGGHSDWGMDRAIQREGRERRRIQRSLKEKKPLPLAVLSGSL